MVAHFLYDVIVSLQSDKLLNKRTRWWWPEDAIYISKRNAVLCGNSYWLIFVV